MSGKDALLALRQQASKKVVPTFSADHTTLQIGNETYSSTTLTPYRIRGKVPVAFFSLDALVVLLEDAAKEKSSVSRYIEETQKQRVQAVSTIQRKEILSYLYGEVASTEHVDIAAFDAHLASSSAASAPTEEAKESDESAGKRQRIGDAGVAQIKPVAEWNVEDIVREEYALSTHLSVLQAKKNLTSMLDLFHKASGDGRAAKPAEASSSRDSREHKSSSSKKEKSRPAPAPVQYHPGNAIPIIIVPAAVSAVVNMYNVVQLLENGVFVSGEKIRAENPAMKKPVLHTISRSSYYDPSKQVTFQVIDDVAQLKSDDDWSRVVAVFVLGAAWQFSDWPKKKWANPAAIFENVCAFHLHFDDEALHANITNWRTHRLPISKSKRHGDRGVVLDFWHLLTEHVAARNTSKKLNI